MSLSYTKWVHFKVSNVIVRDDFLVSALAERKQKLISNQITV
jgi:hypothetical protein